MLQALVITTKGVGWGESMVLATTADKKSGTLKIISWGRSQDFPLYALFLDAAQEWNEIDRYSWLWTIIGECDGSTLVMRLLRKYSTSGYKSRSPGFDFAISQPSTVQDRSKQFPSQSTGDFSLETPITGTRCVKNTYNWIIFLFETRWSAKFC